MQNQLPLDQLLLTSLSASPSFCRNMSAGRHIPAAMPGRRRDEILDFRIRDHPVVHNGLDGINQFRMQRQLKQKAPPEL